MAELMAEVERLTGERDRAHVYARVPADAARTLTDEHPLTRVESLLWPLWTGTVCGAPVTITTP